MMSQDFQIQKFIEADIPNVAGITPEDWGNVTPVFQTHFGQKYFFPIKLVFQNRMIGVAELIVLGKNGWLGNIIVIPEFRNRGLGKILTQELIKIARAHQCESIYLLATPLGKYVYQKLGFQENRQYFFYQKKIKAKNFEKNNNILPYEEKYKNEIFQLDSQAMGEDRSKVITRHLQNTFIYKKPNKKHISGFFIPQLGNGLTICKHVEAGVDFIQKREALGIDKIILPEENQTTIQYLLDNGYSECREPATFMFLGKVKTWKPEMVYCRIGGYLG